MTMKQCGRMKMSISTNLIPTSIPPRISSGSYQKIPRIIHQTFKNNTVTDVFYHNARSFIDLNPEYQYEFYDDERVKQFIENFDCTEFAFDRNTLIKAYNDIKPGAGKADIFRYLVIYELGGVYIDIDSRCVKPLSKSIDSDSDIVTCVQGVAYNYDNHKDRWYHLFPQWVLMHSPKSIIMKEIIEVCINAVSTRTPVPNSESCKNMLERYTGVCCSNYVYRSIFKFRSVEQEARLTPRKFNIKYKGRQYNISILPCIPHLFNNSIISKYIGNVGTNKATYTKEEVMIRMNTYQCELIKNDSVHWLNQSVFND